MLLHWTKVLNSTLIVGYLKGIKKDHVELNRVSNRETRMGQRFNLRRNKRTQSY